MEEHQVTAEGETRKLPEPFFVIATQNPSEQVGTFPLPESQLDRFMMRIELGYPDRDAERALLTGTDRRDMLATLDPCMTPAELMELQSDVQRVHVAPGAARLRAGDRRAHAALARLRGRPVAARRARAGALGARLGAARGPRQGDPGGRAGDPARASPRTACAPRTTPRAASTSARSCWPPSRSHSFRKRNSRGWRYPNTVEA